MKIPSSGDEGIFVRWLKVPSMADEDAFIKKRFFASSIVVINAVRNISL